MKLSDFDYELPSNLIAQNPAEPRDSARLLTLDRHSGQIDDRVFRDIVDSLGDTDVLVINETHVIPARLKGTIVESDIECEIFLHKHIDGDSWDCLVYPGKKLKPGKQVVFRDPYTSSEILLIATIEDISDKGRIVKFSGYTGDFMDILDRVGNIPLPPYITDSDAPDTRYQTIYHNEEKSGSVAAPTAGLHFTPELLENLQNTGVQIERVCLNVGLGTFANVETDDIQQHHMHSETIEIDEITAIHLNTAKSQGKRIIAVGTTSVRTLESMTDEQGVIHAGKKDTSIFIYPGYEWKFVDSIITNFHLPKSTLVMLVSSFAGDENRKKAYRHAIDSQYRFFSFGDAMWIY